MSRITDDPNDPDIRRGPVGGDELPVPQNKAYLVLSEEERAKGFVKPVRVSYKHTRCGGVTTMSREIAETYARNPRFYGATYCVSCRMHRPLEEFTWEPDGEPMEPKLQPRVIVKVMDDGASLVDRIG